MDRHAVLPAAHSEPCRYSFDRQKSTSCARTRAPYAVPRCAHPRRPKVTGKVLPVAQELRGPARNVAGQPSPVVAATLVSCFGVRAAPRSRRQVCRARCGHPAGIVPAWRWSWRTDTDSVAAHAPSPPAV